MFNDNGNENIFKSSLNIFNTKHCIPAIVHVEDPISPYKSETFCVYQSQQNCQLLTEAGGCYKYFCKYPAKIDKQNYINILMDNKKKGSYASNSTYLHNTEKPDMISNKKLKNIYISAMQNIVMVNVQH